MPPDEGVGKRISALIRWNAVAMVLRAGKYAPELGGILHRMHQLQRFMKRDLIIFSKGLTEPMVGICCIFKGIRHQGSTHVLF